MNFSTNFSTTGGARELCLHAAAKRLHIPERTLRYRASRGLIQGAFKRGKLWKFPSSTFPRSKTPACGVAAVALLISLLLPVATPSAQLPAAAPDFALKDSNGRVLRLSSYRGRVVLLNFWATDCGGCLVEIPWFIEFESTYGKAGLEVIGVSMDDGGWKAVRPFLKAKGMNYPVVICNEAVARQYGGIDTLPMSLLIGRDGKILDSHIGVVDRKAWEDRIRSLLKN